MFAFRFAYYGFDSLFLVQRYGSESILLNNFSAFTLISPKVEDEFLIKMAIVS